MTPLRLDLPAGPHRVRLEANSKARTLTVGVVAGAEVTQSVDLDRAVQTGSLFVRSDPAGAKVLVDNKPAGVTLDHRARPGARLAHGVGDRADGATAKQSVQVEAGATAALRPHARPPQVRGGLRRHRADQRLGAGDAPIELQVLPGRPAHRHARAVASAGAGSYDLQLRSADFRPCEARRRRGRPGRCARGMLPMDVNLNAAPWAEVYLTAAASARRRSPTPRSASAPTKRSSETRSSTSWRQMVTVASGKATRLAVTLTKKRLLDE